ncbi:fructose-1,6-bisphosphatase [Alkalibacterium putridalgicola]|uniref:fructose-1,6-bisphosphatase n=1 Tax=Alkalibacterium putridalgicola TaxID=426703 RepID=UPI0034CD4EBC
MDQYYLNLLREKYSTPEAVYTELINLEAIQNLPKGTELYLSDVHGSSAAFEHILRTGAGNVREKLENYYGDEWTAEQKDWFGLLISYPEYALKHEPFESVKDDDWYADTIIHLVKFMGFCAVKYTRSKVRKALPQKYTYIIEELLYTDLTQRKKNLYYRNILNRLISLKQAEPFIIALSEVIQRLVIDHLHLVGDVFDRSSGEEQVMERLIQHHSVDLQWGNHDLLWMGAHFGSKVNLITLLRIAARYGYLFELERTYGLNLRPLFLYAEENYEVTEAFRPKGSKSSSLLQEESEELLAKAHHALAVIQFKLEEQIIERRPEFQMANRQFLGKVDKVNKKVEIDGKDCELTDFPYDRIDENDPARLSYEEEHIVDTLIESFQRSEKIRKYMTFLLEKGRMYLVYNGHLLFHGCLPMDENGDFQSVELEGRKVQGKGMLDAFDMYVRKASQSPDSSEDYATDVLWYAWAGDKSPLFGRNKMTTFERYYIKDKETHKEKRNAYFDLRENEDTVKKILRTFGLENKSARIINGHTPIKVKKGESPIKAGGRLIVIDGGMNEAYRAATGIAGYSLLNNSYGFQIVTHQPFESVSGFFERGKDETSLKHVIDGKLERTLIKDTTIGTAIQKQIDILLEVVEYIQSQEILNEDKFSFDM